MLGSVNANPNAARDSMDASKIERQFVNHDKIACDDEKCHTSCLKSNSP